LPNSLAAKNKVLSLPCFPELTEREVDQVCRVISKNIQYFRKS